VSWIIREHELRPKEADFLSTIFAVGNGRICTRGTLGEDRFGAYRSVFVSGLYTRSPWGLVYYLCAPDWLPCFVRIDGRAAECRESSRELDLAEGVLRRRAVFGIGDTSVEVREERFASFADASLMGQRMSVRRLGGSASVETVLGLDGEIRHARAKYYRPGQFPNVDATGVRLTEIENIGASAGCLKVTLLSRQTKRRSCAFANVRQVSGPALKAVECVEDGLALSAWGIPAGAKEEFAFEKLCVVTGDVPSVESAVPDAEKHYKAMGKLSYADAFAAHAAVMKKFWDVADVEIDGDEEAQRSVRFAVWATRIAAPDDGGASSMAAKNLTGHWYQGGVFWDMDVFQLPLLASVDPVRARNHILYRCRRLDAARQLAAQDGYLGIRFPGKSFDTGVEDPPAIGGLGGMEIHVTFDVAWGVWTYYAQTGDDETMLDAGGLELVLEAANFWLSRIQRDPDGSYHLRNICGPDELHRPVNDNSYKNRMIAELFVQAERLIRHFEKLSPQNTAAVLKKTGVDAVRRNAWRDASERLHRPMISKLVMDQFDGHHKNVPEPNERLLKEKGEGADKIAKQADTVLLFQTIPWAFSREQIEANYREYAPLCNQTSSLSFCTHALVAARLGLVRDAWRYFTFTAGVDLDDSMGNAVHGIHGAAQGGIWMATVWGFGGLQVDPHRVVVDPHLPPWWKSLRYRFNCRRTLVEVSVTAEGYTVKNLGSHAAALTLGTRECTIAPGASESVKYQTTWRSQPLEGVVFDESAIDGADALVASLKAAGLKTAVVFSQKAPAGEKRFDIVVDSDAVTAGKPDLQGCLIATQRMRLLAWNCVGIGRDAASMNAMRRAGLVCVGAGENCPGAHRTVKSLAEISPAMLHNLPEEFGKVLLNPYLERNIEIMKAEARALHM
jgi:kojibiose phosphorylase